MYTFSFVGACLHQTSSVECAAYHRAGYGMLLVPLTNMPMCCYKRIHMDTLSPAGLAWLVLVFCERKTLLAGWFGLAETDKRTGYEGKCDFFVKVCPLYIFLCHFCKSVSSK